MEGQRKGRAKEKGEEKEGDRECKILKCNGEKCKSKNGLKKWAKN